MRLMIWNATKQKCVSAHKSSKNLKRSGGRVHRAYNERINALQKAIKDETWNF